MTGLAFCAGLAIGAAFGALVGCFATAWVMIRLEELERDMDRDEGRRW